MINFLNMKYFLVVAEARSFSAAAKQLYISQQTLSAHIAQIEEEIGTCLSAPGRSPSPRPGSAFTAAPPKCCFSTPRWNGNCRTS